MVFIACGYGFLPVVDYLFVQGANLHVVGEVKGQQYLPIELAACMGHVAVVQFLLSRGAHAARALLYAAGAGQLTVVDALLAAGVYADVRYDGYSALVKAVIHNRGGIVQALLANGCETTRPLDATVLAEVNLRGLNLPAGSTVLHLASALGLQDVVGSLIRATPALRDLPAEGGITPFAVATLGVKPLLNERYLASLAALRCRSGLNDALRDCFAAGGDVNAQDARGFTPLMAAALYNDTESVELLLQHGALPYVRSQVLFIHDYAVTPSSSSAKFFRACC